MRDLVGDLLERIPGVRAVGRPMEEDADSVVSQEGFEEHYGPAFAGGPGYVVVAIGRTSLTKHVVSDVAALWEHKDEIAGGIRRVIGMPSALWGQLKAQCTATDEITDLTAVAAPAPA